MSDSRALGEGPAGADGGHRRPRYDQAIRWTEYTKAQPPEMWGPQQNAVVNGQTESAQTVDASTEDRKQIRVSVRTDHADQFGAEESAITLQAILPFR